jgi:hypothetical protein
MRNGSPSRERCWNRLAKEVSGLASVLGWLSQESTELLPNRCSAQLRL